jgi:hypothetical protein
MDEMDRCSKSHIMGREDYASTSAGKIYRSNNNMYWRHPFDEIWKQRFPEYDMSVREICTGDCPQPDGTVLPLGAKAVVYRIDK